MYAITTPADELDDRLVTFQKVMREKGVSGALIVQKTDLFYYSGTSQQGWLYIPDDGAPLLMIFKDFERAQAESALENSITITGASKIPEALAAFGIPSPAVLGLELDVLPVNLYLQYKKIIPTAEVVDISLEIRLQRSVKSLYELELMGQAARFSDKVAARVPDLLELGKTEVTVAGELEGYARSLGHQGLVRMRLWGAELFYGHLMSGSDAAVPSYLASPTGGSGVSPVIGQGAGFTMIAENEPILVDYVFGWKGYLSDHARIFCIGKLSDELVRGHEAMLEIQDMTKKLGVPGAVTGEIYEEMISMAAKKGVADYFMGSGERRIRFTGHGIGLELDEFPFIAKGQKLELAEGMVVALEPKVIIPGKGVVGIENTHVVTNNGFDPLTRITDNIVYI